MKVLHDNYWIIIIIHNIRFGNLFCGFFKANKKNYYRYYNASNTQESSSQKPNMKLEQEEEYGKDEKYEIAISSELPIIVSIYTITYEVVSKSYTLYTRRKKHNFLNVHNGTVGFKIFDHFLLQSDHRICFSYLFSLCFLYLSLSLSNFLLCSVLM